MAQWANRIKSASGGRIEITVHPVGEIVPFMEIPEGVRDGAIEMGRSPSNYIQESLGPLTWLLTPGGLPANVSGRDCIAWVYVGGGLEIYNEIYKDLVGVVVGVAAWPAELFCHSTKILDEAADFKGIKFRTQGPWAEILKEYGASVVNIPPGELYQAVQTGVVDAFELGPPSYNWPLGFQEICKYIGVPGIQSPGSGEPIAMNTKVWNDLPGDLQDILRGETMAMNQYGYDQMLLGDAEALKNYRDYGTQIFTVKEEFQTDIANRSKAMMEKYAAADPKFRQIWEQQKDFYKKWRALGELIPKPCIFD
jgi:TRAP-type mannitol/chloroaromatic compound transport system substrate-binding protein